MLAEVCKLGPLKSNQINSCKSILNLSSSETKRHSRESLRAIEEGAKFIQKLGSSGEKAVETLLRSSNYNRTAIGILWLSQDVFRNKDKYFLMDVWDKLQYDKQRGTYKGYNGYGICSSDYIKAIYKEAFGGKLYSSLGGSTNASGMKKALENIVQEIKYDLEQGRRNNDYIKDASAKDC